MPLTATLVAEPRQRRAPATFHELVEQYKRPLFALAYDPELHSWVEEAEQGLQRVLEGDVREPDDVAESGGAS